MVTRCSMRSRRSIEKGATVLMVEQNAKRALEISHRAFVLELVEIASKAPAGRYSTIRR
jgi:ABC-type branched-subunit amino acid transport system ATPase component